MRLTGTLRTWHEDRGFGFIAPTQGGREVFVHVSAFPRDSSRPLAGEKLGYELGTGNDGKPQALRVQRLAWAGAAGASTAGRQHPHPRSRSLLRTWLVVAALLGMGVFAYRHFQGAVAPLPMAQVVPPVSEAPAPAPHEPAPAPVAEPRREAAAAARPIRPSAAPAQEVAVAPPPTGRCDGRTHCSQMSSCAEATYFLRNCPGTQMDGDGDGIPCEAQWCQGPSGR